MPSSKFNVLIWVKKYSYGNVTYNKNNQDMIDWRNNWGIINLILVISYYWNIKKKNIIYSGWYATMFYIIY